MKLFNEAKEVLAMVRMARKMTKGSEQYLPPKGKKALVMINTIGLISGATLVNDIIGRKSFKTVMINQTICSVASFGVVAWHPSLFKEQYEAGFLAAQAYTENNK